MNGILDREMLLALGSGEMDSRLTPKQLQEIEARLKALSPLDCWGDSLTSDKWEGVLTDLEALLAEIKALQQSEQRVIDLEDAITQAGLILSGPEDMPEVARHVIKGAMKSLGSVMNDPKILKRQGI